MRRKTYQERARSNACRLTTSKSPRRAGRVDRDQLCKRTGTIVRVVSSRAFGELETATPFSTYTRLAQFPAGWPSQCVKTLLEFHFSSFGRLFHRTMECVAVKPSPVIMRVMRQSLAHLWESTVIITFIRQEYVYSWLPNVALLPLLSHPHSFLSPIFSTATYAPAGFCQQNAQTSSNQFQQEFFMNLDSGLGCVSQISKKRLNFRIQGCEFIFP